MYKHCPFVLYFIILKCSYLPIPFFFILWLKVNLDYITYLLLCITKVVCCRSRYDRAIDRTDKLLKRLTNAGDHLSKFKWVFILFFISVHKINNIFIFVNFFLFLIFFFNILNCSFFY